MTEKLSPSEFLAELKQQPAPAAHLAPADSEGDPLDELDFDFPDPDEGARPERDEPSAPAAASAPPGEQSPPAAGESEQCPRGPSDEPRSGNAAENGDHRTAEETSIAEEEGVLSSVPTAIRGNRRLSELFERVNTLLGGSGGDSDEKFRPKVPESLEEAQLTFEEVERLVLKFLLSKGSATGRGISAQLRLPFQLVDPILRQLKQEQVLAFRGAAQMGDYEFAITDYGRERARRYNEECTYFGAAPVSLHEYLKAMAAQSIAKQEATEESLHEAFSDLIINEKMLDKLGPAVNSGRGMFLFGEPGNGKTSIAERITRCFGSTIWIPRTLGIDGDIIRLFDPGIHEVVEEDHADGGIFDLSGIDQRWVHIARPTVIAGGELTMNELEVSQNPQTKICEAPLQLKSNCGTLVIDDFGRQTMPVDVLLNRWIVPLEKRYDFLNLPSGKKVQVPFDQLIIFSTNLEPKDLVDGAFLRRIPYKIEVTDPSEDEFRALFERIAPLFGFEYDREAFDYLIETHYRPVNRPFRSCQPRDLLLQVRNYCTYKRLPKRMSPEAFDFAVENYFSVM